VDWVDAALIQGESSSETAASSPATVACRADPTDVLRKWKTAPGALMAHPREEHLIPLLVATAAATGMGSAEKLFGDVWMAGSFSLTGYMWKADAG